MPWKQDVCTQISALLKYTLPFLYARIVVLLYFSGLSRCTPGDRLTS